MTPDNDVREIEDYSASSGIVVRQDPVFYGFVLRQTATFKKFFSNLNAHTVTSYLVVGLPSANPAGQVAYVSNEAGGPVLAFSDGTNWRRVTDRAIVS